MQKSALKLNIITEDINHQHPKSLDFIQHYVRPESKLEQEIIKDKAWMQGAFWGVPRPGHPEGRIIYHIREVLDNVDRLVCGDEIRAHLRLITIIHDTFKYLEETIRPRTDWSKHHAAYARNFAAQFIEDEFLLDIIELHDEAYYAWRHEVKGRKKIAANQINRLFDRLGEEHLQLFYLFFKCDTQTGDKTQDPIYWFESNITEIEVMHF